MLNYLREPAAGDGTVDIMLFCKYYVAFIWKAILGPLTLFSMRNGLVVMSGGKIWFYKFGVMGKFSPAAEVEHDSVAQVTVKEGRRSCAITFVLVDGQNVRIECPFKKERQGLFLHQESLDFLKQKFAGKIVG